MLLLGLSSCSTSNSITFIPKFKELTTTVDANKPAPTESVSDLVFESIKQPEQVKTAEEIEFWKKAIEESKAIGLMPWVEGTQLKVSNEPNLFKLTDIQTYNVGKFKPAIASDFGFNPDSSSNLVRVSNNGTSAWLVKQKSKNLSYSSAKADKVTYIIPSRLLTDEYLKNPFNVLALIGSLCEGHGSWNGKVFVFNSNVAKHEDPGSNKGEFKFNVGLFSGQQTPITGAHKAIDELSKSMSGKSDENIRLEIFKGGLYIDATREYIPQMIDGLKRHGVYDRKMSIMAFINLMDTFVQNGTGRNDGHKTNLFLKTYFKLQNSSRSEIIAFLKSKRVDSTDLDGGFVQMGDESLRIFASRMNVFVENDVTRKEFCFNQDWCGMGRVNKGQQSYTPGITWTKTVANDQFRRLQSVWNITSFQDFQRLANAKISAIPDGK